MNMLNGGALGAPTETADKPMLGQPVAEPAPATKPVNEALSRAMRIR